MIVKGLIQSLINPPGNPKARFLTNPANPPTADAFLAGAETHQGSWWPHWAEWLSAHGGDKVAAPKTRGSKKHKPGIDDPGSYVVAAACRRDRPGPFRWPRGTANRIRRLDAGRGRSLP
jgi:poly(3-hydroxyalkanoate) synthetase